MQAGHLQPLPEEMFLHAGLSLEDGQRNGPEGEMWRRCLLELSSDLLLMGEQTVIHGEF